MKQSIRPFLGLAASLAAGFLSAQTPVLHYDFNASSAKSYPSQGSAKDAIAGKGDKQQAGGSGSGVSGRKDDRAWDATANTTAGAVTPANNARLETAAGINALDSLEAFTVVLWFTSEQTLDSAVRLFGRTDSATKQTTGFVLRTYTPKKMGGKAAVELGIGNGTTRSTFVSDYCAKGRGFNITGAKNKWVFLAVTWDGSMVRFYAGNTGEKVAAAGARAYKGRMAPATGKPLIIGNTSGKNRGLDGKIDNFRIYNLALGLDQLETIRQSDAGQ